ncbi:SMP-30/gluconolactonase/LRE family protein [Massilia sp. HP4]|uniref:SMP-30/gluconolactonase/LRE family protein n=1 Tax=Massilia sp. HP4 TaxID=2562316 RepID=UPI0010C0BE9E|nr:L-dopachrome tautomerase-related protein [Massilia sp. HP4]
MANEHEQQDPTRRAAPSTTVPASNGNALAIAARSPEFLCNAVALTAAGTMFLGLPRWTGMRDTPSVVRVDADGELQPFPGGAWNDWAFGKPVEHAFVQVNALHVFGDDTLWVVDQGAPDRKATLAGAQKVLQFDTRSGELLRALRFDAGILPDGACLNDLRIWGSRIYLTDSGLGALVVHDLATGRTLRRLEAHPLLLQSEVQPMRGSGRRVLVDADGERPRVGCDFLEVSPDGEWLYFSTPTGPFRRVPTALLCDQAVDDEALAAAIEEVAANPTLNGTAMDSRGNLYLANAEQRRIEVRAPSGQRAVLASDERLVDPDALFITRDRRLFVPATQSELLPEHDGGQNGIERPFLVLSMALPDSVDGIPLGHAIAPVLSAPA